MIFLDGKAEIRIWSRSISFRAYNISKTIKFDKLEKVIKEHSGNSANKKEGWLTNTPYFKNEDNSVATFVYLTFKRDAGASRVEGHDVYVPDPIGFSFYFNEGLLIVSTANDSKLRSTVEKRIFNSIALLGQPIAIRYPFDFLYWLAYKHDNRQAKITDNLLIDDIKAVSSEIETFNLNGAVSANTKVTNYVHAQVLLALNGWANGANLDFICDDVVYSLRLFSDGRINAAKREDIEAREEKVIYALKVHNLLQEAYKEFIKIEKTKEWGYAKNEYRRNMTKKGIDKLNELLSKLEHT